jgi:hypothetical protein
LAAVEHELRLASEQGYKALAARWNQLPPDDRDVFVVVRDRELIPRARECDKIWADQEAAAFKRAAEQPPNPVLTFQPPKPRTDLLV